MISSTYDMRQLLGSAEVLVALIDVIKDPKLMKKTIAELEKAEELVAQANDVRKSMALIDEIKATFSQKEADLAEKEVKLTRLESALGQKDAKVKDEQVAFKALKSETEKLVKESEAKLLQIANSQAALDKRSEEIAKKVADYDLVASERDDYKSKFETLTKAFSKVG